jgi:uncharacterized protein YaaQ
VKLTLTVVRDDDTDGAVDALTAQGFFVTRLSSTGGFLRIGNTVLLIGVEDDQLAPMLEIIKAHTEIHIQPPQSDASQETPVSRAVVFVLELKELVKL